MEATIDHELGSFNSLNHICSTEILDISIEDATNTKNKVDSKMDSIMILLEEVECREKAAEKAKQEADQWSLHNLTEMNELKRLQHLAKETYDLRAREVYAQKAALATEMGRLQLRVSVVLDEGDKSLDVLDELRKSLEERLSLAKIKKEAACKDKLEKEMALAYQKREMEKLVEESKKLEQEAKENMKLQKFLQHRCHVVNILQEEISSKSHNVTLLKAGLEVYQNRGKFSKLENSSRPMIQEAAEREEYEVIKCNNINQMKGLKGRVADSKKELKAYKMCKSSMKTSMNKVTRKYIEEQIMEGLTDYKDNHLALEG